MSKKESLVVVKIGGNIVDNPAALADFLSDFHQLKGKKVLVHGGGVMATKLADELGIETKKVDGRRITDEETLKVVAMVYAGWINKNMVAVTNRFQRIGLSALMPIVSVGARQSNRLTWFVGDLIPMNKLPVYFTIMESNIVPVFALSPTTKRLIIKHKRRYNRLFFGNGVSQNTIPHSIIVSRKGVLRI